MTIGDGCTCNRMWNSITPPPPCPVHPPAGYWYVPQQTTWSGIRTACRGRHCAHDHNCGTYYLRNGG